MRFAIVAAIALLTAPAPALAGEADVLKATATPSGGGKWTVSATIRHGDTGWDHYADGFEVLAPDGTSLGVRVLYHPHVNEQPFTRSLTGVVIPEDVNRIVVRAKDSVHGAGGVEATVVLKR